jgi:hypothetical protein
MPTAVAICAAAARNDNNGDELVLGKLIVWQAW